MGIVLARLSAGCGLLPPQWARRDATAVLRRPRGPQLKIADADILIVPGLGNSGPGHRQRRWADRTANGRVVEQAEWDEPVLADWVDRVHQEVMLSTRPVVLIGHSLGVSAIVHTAQLRLKDAKVRGAFLVSPPDLERMDMPSEIHNFRQRAD